MSAAELTGLGMAIAAIVTAIGGLFAVRRGNAKRDSDGSTSWAKLVESMEKEIARRDADCLAMHERLKVDFEGQLRVVNKKLSDAQQRIRDLEEDLAEYRRARRSSKPT